MRWIVLLLTVLSGPVKAPVPVQRSKIIEHTVTIIECNEVVGSLTQHVYWQWTLVQDRETGRDTYRLVNRGWRLTTNKHFTDGIGKDGQNFTDTFVECNQVYRVTAPTIYYTRYDFDVEIANRQHYRPIVP